jgi:GTP pyrophosphokinase
VAAHWAYKEAGAKGYAGAQVSDAQAKKMAVLRQLLAWRENSTKWPMQIPLLPTQANDDKIYVSTPQAAVG